MSKGFFALMIALAPLFAGCTGGGSVQPLPPPTDPSPVASATPSIVTFSVDVPANGNIQVTIPASTGYSGTILFPVYQGSPGTVSATFSGLVPAGSNPLGVGLYSPVDVNYACFVFQPTQLPSGVPIVDLSTVPTVAGLKTVGFAYRERGGGIWDQHYGTAQYATTAHIITVNSVGLRNDGTCFALFVSS